MRCRRGSSLAEMAIMLPVYVILITGAIYLAQISLSIYGAHKAVGYAAAQGGEQRQSDVEDMMPLSGSAMVTDFEDQIDEEEMWSGSDIDDVLEELARAPVGHYEFQDGEIIYVLDEDRLSAFGDYIFDNELQAESGNVADVMAGWMYRTRSEMSRVYQPMFGDWEGVEIKSIASSSYVSGDMERGTHPPEQPDFNRDIFNMLSDTDFPQPLDPEPFLWLSQIK